jgi:TonB family protein
MRKLAGIFGCVLAALFAISSRAAEKHDDGCVPASYVKTVTPSYPTEKLAHHVTGTTIVNVTIGRDGTPTATKVKTSSGDEALDQSALTAAQQFRFNPKKCHGLPIASRVLVPFAFNRHDYSADSLKFAADEKPLEFENIADEVNFLRLRSNTDRRSNEEGDVYFDTTRTFVWIVRKAPDGHDGFVVRVRPEWRAENLYQFYATQCDGPEGWCGGQLDWCLDMVQSTPLTPTDERPE